MLLYIITYFVFFPLSVLICNDNMELTKKSSFSIINYSDGNQLMLVRDKDDMKNQKKDNLQMSNRFKQHHKNENFSIINYSDGNQLMLVRKKHEINDNEAQLFISNNKHSIEINTYPNPSYSNILNISFECEKSSNICIFGFQEGQDRVLLFNGISSVGNNDIDINLMNFSTGVVFLYLESNNKIFSTKFVKM